LPGIRAVHEPLNGLKSKDEFYRLVEEHPDTIFIDSGLYLTDWQARWPDARSVIVHRPLPDVLESLARLGIQSDRTWTELLFAEGVYTQAEGLHVRYDRINDRLQQIHEYLTDEAFDPIHAERTIAAHLELDEITGDPDSYRIWKE
jgi:hypothetical protein